MSKFVVKEVEEEEDIRRVERESTFLVTINDNKAFQDPEMAKQEKASLKSRVDTVFGPGFEKYLKLYEDNGHAYVRQKMTVEQVEATIISGEIESHIEIGKKFKRMHCHTMIKISHYDYIIKLDVEALSKVFGPNCYVNARFIKDNKFDMRRYIRKEKMKNNWE